MVDEQKIKDLIQKYNERLKEMNVLCNKQVENNKINHAYHTAGTVFAIKTFISDLEQVLN